MANKKVKRVKKPKKRFDPDLLARRRRLALIEAQTPSEKYVKELLKQTDYSFDFQYIIFFGRLQFYILDFYIPKLKLCIELDGSHHYNDDKQLEHDRLRGLRLSNKGIRTIRIPNSEALKLTKETLIELLL